MIYYYNDGLLDQSLSPLPLNHKLSIDETAGSIAGIKEILTGSAEKLAGHYTEQCRCLPVPRPPIIRCGVGGLGA